MNPLPRLARVALLALACIGAASCTTTRPAATATPTRVDPADPAFVYEGRFDTADPHAPVLIWEASRILLAFTGDSLRLHFGAASDQVYLDATIDGRTSRVDLVRGKPARGADFSGLGAGRHELVLFKRSEASAGHVAFLGAELAAGGTAVPVARPAARLRVEFIGDSITAGACNEDPGDDQWADRSTHNAAKSYATLTAAALGAEVRVTAVSGMGVCTGYTEVRAREAWNGIYPSASSPRANLALWHPDIAFINLGENDTSFTLGHGKPFPSDFADRYVDLVQAVRAAHPNAHIVLLRGGMGGGATNPVLRAAWEAAVSRAEAADPAVHHFVFEHWSTLHPRVADDEAMAGELSRWLRAQPFAR